MILINIYGKIQPTIISRKLGVGLCNPNLDWVSGFCDDFDEEILIHNHNMKTFSKHGYDIRKMEGRYNLPEIEKILGWQEKGKSAKQTIAEHLIEIKVIDFENSLLQKNNEYMDNPTCEPQYTKKFMGFCSVVQNSDKAQSIIPGQIPFITYDSDKLRESPLIINYLQGKSQTSLNTYTSDCIRGLQYLGEKVDEFLSEDKDFWLFDYIVNTVHDDSSIGAYHIFKVMSLIEMLIINPNGKGKTVGEMEKKLPQFLPNTVDIKQKELFSTIMRKLRNKIGHGDFMCIQKLLEEYRNFFMKDFWFDEFEYSIENWTYENICINLDKTLANILWLMIYDKERLLKIQEG